MPVWDVPAGDEMGPRPGARSLTRTRRQVTGRLEIYARPHKAPAGKVTQMCKNTSSTGSSDFYMKVVEAGKFKDKH